MKLSASFNFFDGGELLVPAVENIRPVVDHISVVWQSLSNFGSEISSVSRKAIEELERKALVDIFVHYTPDLSQGGTF